MPMSSRASGGEGDSSSAGCGRPSDHMAPESRRCAVSEVWKVRRNTEAPTSGTSVVPPAPPAPRLPHRLPRKRLMRAREVLLQTQASLPSITSDSESSDEDAPTSSGRTLGPGNGFPAILKRRARQDDKPIRPWNLRNHIYTCCIQRQRDQE
mmetsp:Transcript_106202/g.298589  ORF Transcript_106202/g.298589 Transcript_106202/m.298589 type:complete len:152 (-) Transcript_106202:185-640(-)